MDRRLSLRIAAEERPDGVAAIVEDTTYTFSDLWARTAPLVAWLDARVPKHAPMGFVAHGTLESLLFIYAGLELGRPLVPLHPRLTPREREQLGRAWPDVYWLREAPGVVTSMPDWAPSPVDDEQPLAIVQSSGTSGVPKGVVLSRRAFLASAAASCENLGWQADDRWLLAMPLAHVGGLSIVIRTLVARRALVLLGRFQVASWLDAVRAHHVTLASVVPAMLARLLSHTPAWNVPSHLRAMLLGGDRAPDEALRRAASRGWPVLTTYGLTEACSQVTTQQLGTAPAPEQGCGVPLRGVDLKIASDSEILVRSATLLSAYYGTTPVLPLDADGFFATGDLGCLDAAGRLHVVGRKSDTLITGGENVQPREVEQVLEEHPKIACALVAAEADVTWGQRLVAFVVLGAAQDVPRARELDAWVETRLASFKRPRAYYVVQALPRTAQGKLDRRAVGALPRIPLDDG